MAQLSIKDMDRQERSFAGALAKASPLGDMYFVDATNGSNGNDGLSRRHPFATLVHALTKAAAGDTIILAPGGSETVTATIAASTAKVGIFCPVDDARNGY